MSDLVPSGALGAPRRQAYWCAPRTKCGQGRVLDDRPPPRSFGTSTMCNPTPSHVGAEDGACDSFPRRKSRCCDRLPKDPRTCCASRRRLPRRSTTRAAPRCGSWVAARASGVRDPSTAGHHKPCEVECNVVRAYDDPVSVHASRDVARRADRSGLERDRESAQFAAGRSIALRRARQDRGSSGPPYARVANNPTIARSTAVGDLC